MRVPRLACALLLGALIGCDSSPSGPSGSAGTYALVQFGDQGIPMQLRRPAAWQGLFCADLVQSQLLDLGRDRSASLLTRTSYPCDDGRSAGPDSSRDLGTYRATADSVILMFPSSTSAIDSLAWPMTRSGDRLVYSLGPIYTESGAIADTFRLVYQRTR